MQNDKPDELRSCVEQCLTGFGYPFLTSRRGDIRFHIHTATVPYRSQFIIHEKESPLVDFLVYMDDDFPVDWTPQVAELALRLNDQAIKLGCFGLLNHGEVYFRYAVDLRVSGPSVGAVENMLNAASYPIELWEGAFGLLKKVKAPPKTCVEAAMIRLGVADEEKVSKAAKVLSFIPCDGPAGSGSHLRAL